jgi:hypothetical protein
LKAAEANMVERFIEAQWFLHGATTTGKAELLMQTRDRLDGGVCT